jgi:hypothetical protein
MEKAINDKKNDKKNSDKKRKVNEKKSKEIDSKLTTDSELTTETILINKNEVVDEVDQVVENDPEDLKNDENPIAVQSDSDDENENDNENEIDYDEDENDDEENKNNDLEYENTSELMVKKNPSRKVSFKTTKSSSSSSSRLKMVDGTKYIFQPADVVVLKNLNYTNIVDCENYMRRSNLTNQTVHPISKWIDNSNQFLIDLKFARVKFPGYEKWREQDYFGWLFPNLKKVYPQMVTQAHTVSPSERVVELKPFFSQINVWKEETMNKCVTKMQEILLNNPAAMSLAGAELTALIAKLYDQMVDKNRENRTAEKISL